MKFRNLSSHLLISLLLVLISSHSLAAMYKYQDEKGDWVYSQHPPAEGSFTTIKAQKQSRSSRLSTEARQQKVNQAKESVLGKPGEKEAKSKSESETAKNNAKRQDICDRSKKGLEQLQIYRRFKDKDGKITVLDDETRAKQIANAKANIEQFCK